jgi:hypothetical protein
MRIGVFTALWGNLSFEEPAFPRLRSGPAAFRATPTVQWTNCSKARPNARSTWGPSPHGA